MVHRLWRSHASSAWGCAFLLVRHQIQSPAWLERMTWAFLAVGGLYLFSLLLPGLHSVSRLFPSAVGGSLFWTWITAMSFSQAVFNRKLHPAWRVALGAVLAAAMYISLVQKRDWNSGWTPALVTIVVILWAGAPKFGLLATLVGGAAALSRFGAVENFAMAGDNQYSLMTRVEAWRILAEIIKVNPIFGLGPANYYWYTPLFPILGYAVKFNSHNNYVDLVAQTGLLGLACFLWFAWEVGRAGWRLRLQVPEGFQQAYVYGALGGLAGTIVAGMLGDWFLPFVYNIGFAGFRASVLGWLFLGGLMSLESSVGTESTAG
jgi:O-antigen ligase